MKKLLFVAVVAFSSVLAFADGAKCSCCATTGMTTAKANREARRLAHEAKMCKMSVEDFSKLSKAEQRAKVDEVHTKNRADMFGMSVEAYKAMTPTERRNKYKEIREKRNAEKAKLCGMTLEEFMKLRPADRAKKILDARRSKRPRASK